MVKDTRSRTRDFFWIVIIPVMIGLAAGCTVSAYAKPADGAGRREPAAPRVLQRCVLVLDVASGERLHSDGDCSTRRAPESTFKVPLALIGFETGVLEGPHAPVWSHDGTFPAPLRDHKDVDPVIWERDSVVWFSQTLTTRLAQKDGATAFDDWVARLDYGNRDVSGDAGKNNGLTHAWLSSSLKISPEEQAAFVRRLLRDDLPASPRAMRLTRDIIPEFAATGGWTVHGKTGSSKTFATARGALAHGWFVGWAQKDGRTLAFAVYEQALNRPVDQPVGPAVRQGVLRDFQNYVQ